MIKLVFFKDGRAEFVDPKFLQNTQILAQFDVTETMSQFSPRYKLVDDQPVDRFPELSDEEVAKELHREEQEKAAELAAKFAAEAPPSKPKE